MATDYNDSQLYEFDDVIAGEQQMLQDDSQPDFGFKSDDLFSIVKNETALEMMMSNITSMEDDLYKNQRILSAFAYGAIIIISLFGNLLVCKVCIVKMTKTNALILSLALSDLSMTIFNIPFNYFRIANYSWPFGKVMCYVVNFVQHLVVYVSSYTMLTIAIYRYVTVTDATGSRGDDGRNPLAACIARICCWCRSKNRTYSLRNIMIVIIFVWIISACLAVIFTYSSDVVEREPFASLFIKQLIYSNQNEPGWIDNVSEILSKQTNILRCQNPMSSFWATLLKQYFNQLDDLVKSLIVFCTQFLVPLTIAIVLYIRIGKIINEQGRLASAKNDLKAKTKQKQKYRRIMMLVWVVCTFGVCWLPLHIFHILTDAGLLAFNQTIFISVHWFAMLSVMCNPFIYCWLNPFFWASAKKCFCCCFSQTEKATVQKIIVHDENGRIAQDVPFKLKLLGYILCCRQYSNTSVDRQYIRHDEMSTNALPLKLVTTKPDASNASFMTETTTIPYSSGDEGKSMIAVDIQNTLPDDQAGRRHSNLEGAKNVYRLVPNPNQVNMTANTQYDSINCQQASLVDHNGRGKKETIYLNVLVGDNHEQPSTYRLERKEQ